MMASASPSSNQQRGVDDVRGKGTKSGPPPPFCSAHSLESIVRLRDSLTTATTSEIASLPREYVAELCALSDAIRSRIPGGANIATLNVSDVYR